MHKNNYNNTSIETYIICDLIDNAYNTIEDNDLAQRLLKLLDISKEEITISQNRSRELLKISLNNKYTYDNYKIIKVGKHQSLLGLHFNESLTKIEGVYIKRNLFSSYPGKLFTQEEASDYLSNLFKILDTKIDFTKYLSIELNKEFYEYKDKIEILLHNKNSFKIDYPNMNIHLKNYDYINIFFNDQIDFDFYHNMNYASKYLNQNIVDMYPDFGMASFWVDGASSGIEEFREFVNEDDPLAKEIENWVGIFNSKAPCNDDLYKHFDFNWDEYNLKGKKLHQRLQKIVQSKFIIPYWMSYQESINKWAHINYGRCCENTL